MTSFTFLFMLRIRLSLVKENLVLHFDVWYTDILAFVKKKYDLSVAHSGIHVLYKRLVYIKKTHAVNDQLIILE